MGPSGYTLEITLNLVQIFFFFSHVHVAVRSYPSVKFYFFLFWGMVMYGNEFKTKENKISIKDKSIEPKLHTRESWQFIRGPLKFFFRNPFDLIKESPE